MGDPYRDSSFTIKSTDELIAQITATHELMLETFDGKTDTGAAIPFRLTTRRKNRPKKFYFYGTLGDVLARAAKTAYDEEVAAMKDDAIWDSDPLQDA